MAREVIMPALGMAQETGVLVAWLKSPGDQVSADDPLMEVETDKTTMEVPAGADGIVAELRAETGSEVPVGQVIAVIAAPGEDISALATQADEPTPAAEPEPIPAVEPEPPAAPQAETAPSPAAPVPANRAPAAPSGRVLASPKARRLALEQGIDLRDLVAVGVSEPLHAKDIEAGRAMLAQSVGGISFVTARCDSENFYALVERIIGSADVELEPHVVVAGFCAAGLRKATGADRVVVAVESRTGLQGVAYADPDMTRPTRPHLADDEPASLVLRDMTGSRITGVAAAGDKVPAITVSGGKEAGSFDLSLTFSQGGMDLPQAIVLLEEVAERLESPLRFLA